MERVDWTIEEGPKCKDCAHYRDGINAPNYCAILFHGMSRLAWATQMRQDLKHVPSGNLNCGPEARYFERRIPEGDYDFANNPPNPMAWAEDGDSLLTVGTYR